MAIWEELDEPTDEELPGVHRLFRSRVRAMDIAQLVETGPVATRMEDGLDGLGLPDSKRARNHGRWRWNYTQLR
ncbi:unnamed protein product [Angiostrongylus costaricensis]|uniref:Cation_ATPase_N domain-containing protein n=1 Tax=Angiostrongylus costaricensis TaxID=334426 RepID=A0A0R3PHP0_ANGCS|nr:unnamed protein product [Angiostrongylus costaricensis]